MNQKKLNVLVRIFSLAMITVMMFSTLAYATFKDIKPNTSTAMDKATGIEAIKNVLGIIQVIGFIIAIGIIIYIGIKYLMASAAEKADLKGNLVKYLIGAVLVAGGPVIVSVIFNAVSGN